MADNIQLNLGAGGEKLASDQMATGEQVQRVELVTVSSDVLSDVNINNPLPIMDANGSLTVDGTLNTVAIPAESGGLLCRSRLCDNSINAYNIKSSAGQVYAILAANKNADVAYLRLYNKATVPDPSEDSSLIVMRIPLTGGTTMPVVAFRSSIGVAFTSGIGYAVSTGIADTDETAPAANEIILNIFYK